MFNKIAQIKYLVTKISFRGGEWARISASTLIPFVLFGALVRTFAAFHHETKLKRTSIAILYGSRLCELLRVAYAEDINVNVSS